MLYTVQFRPHLYGYVHADSAEAAKEAFQRQVGTVVDFSSTNLLYAQDTPPYDRPIFSLNDFLVLGAPDFSTFEQEDTKLNLALDALKADPINALHFEACLAEILAALRLQTITGAEAQDKLDWVTQTYKGN